MTATPLKEMGERDLLLHLVNRQESIESTLRRLIRMTDALTTAVTDLQNEDTALAAAVAAFIATGAGPLQAQLDAANAKITDLTTQIAGIQSTDAATIQGLQDTAAAAQAEITGAAASVEAEVGKLVAVQASVTPAPAPTPTPAPAG